MKTAISDKASQRIFLFSLVIIILAINPECPAQNSLEQNLPDKYQAILNNVLPSLAVFFEVHYTGEINLAEFSISFYETGGDSAWGCIINENGDMITVSGLLKACKAASGFTYLSHQNALGNNRGRHFDIKKVVSKTILNDYAIVSTDVDKSDFIPARIISSPVNEGDSIFILLKPFSPTIQIIGGSIRAIRDDPLLGEMIEIECLNEIPKQIGLACNEDGELYGLVLSVRLATSQRVFAISAAKLNRFAAKDKRVLKELADDTRFQIGTNIRNLFADGLIKFWQGEYLDAQSLFQEIITIDPNHALTNIYYAACKLKMGDTAEAEKYYQKAFELNDDLDEAQYQLAHICFEQDRTDDAIDAYKKAISTNGNNPYYYYELGMIYKDLGKKKATKRMHAKLKRLDKDLAEELME